MRPSSYLYGMKAFIQSVLKIILIYLLIAFVVNGLDPLLWNIWARVFLVIGVVGVIGSGKEL